HRREGGPHRTPRQRRRLGQPRPYQNVTIGTFWYAPWALRLAFVGRVAVPERDKPYQNVTIGTFWYAPGHCDWLSLAGLPYQNVTIGTFWYAYAPGPSRRWSVRAGLVARLTVGAPLLLEPGLGEVTPAPDEPVADL